VDEAEDRDDPEPGGEREPPDAPPAVRARDAEQLEQRGAGTRRAEQDRDRVDAPLVELEDEEREDEPERADDEVEPPERGLGFARGGGSGRRGAKAARDDELTLSP
jgi:hypothetical protein